MQINPVIPIIACLVTGIIGIFLEKFKNRLSIFKYKIRFQPLATSSQIPHWGSIEVYHEGRQTKHLNFVTIEIENDSNVDHQDVKVQVMCDEESQFLQQSAFFNKTSVAILLDQEYYDYFVDVRNRYFSANTALTLDPSQVIPDELQREVDYVEGNKIFKIPVLNRRTCVTFNLLTENFQGKIPAITVNVIHKSVKLVRRADANSEESREFMGIAISSVLVFLVSFSLLLYTYKDSRYPLIYCGLSSISSGILGFLLYKIFKSVQRLFL